MFVEFMHPSTSKPVRQKNKLQYNVDTFFPFPFMSITGALPYSMELNLTSNKEVEVEVEAASNNASKSEDEEG